MSTEITVQHYRPSEIIALFNELLSRQSAQTGGRLMCLRGIYMAKNANPQWQFCYDALHDEATQDELTIRLTHQQRQSLSSGNLVEVIGTLGRNINTKGTIQLILNVSRIDIVQEQVVNEDEVKRFELRTKKVEQGFKNVDNILESLLFNDKQPRIALLLASSSITLTDFEAGINAAKVSLEFHEERVTFTHSKELCDKLKDLDKKDFDAIALVRGGGIDPNTDVDLPDVVETVVSLNTPFICAVGHGEEKIFLRQVSDKWTATPQGLGQYFSELVESVSERKNKSRAALTEKIKKQFKDQLEKLEKQNKETQEKFNKLNKQQEEAQKLHKQQIEAAQKQNKEIQEKFDKLTKQQEEVQKIHKGQMDKLNETHKTQLTKLNESQTKLQEQLKKQQEESNKRATDLNKTLAQVTSQNAQLNKELLASQKQLADAKASNGSYNVLLLVLVAVLFVIIVILLLTS